MQLRRTSRIPPVGLDSLARPLRDQRWRHHNALVPRRRQLALDAITARPRLIAEPQLYSLPAELARQPLLRRRCVHDPTIFPHLASPAAFGYRHNDPVLGNIKPDICDTTPQDPSPMHQARHRPIRAQASLPVYCETGRPVLRRTRGLERSLTKHEEITCWHDTR
jgi:hypothetical protein